MTIDIERLKHDLDYWLEVAPEGAEFYSVEAFKYKAGWIKDEPGKTGYHFVREASLSWSFVRAENIPQDCTLIPRPSPAWDGSGLPVEGTVCRMRLAFRTEDRITITYMGDGVFCYRAENGMEYTGSLSDAAFEPLKTEKERVCEFWRAKMPYPGSNSTMLDMEALYDAGALKMPGGEV